MASSIAAAAGAGEATVAEARAAAPPPPPLSGAAAAAPPPPVNPMPSMTKILFLSSIGSVLEWMDFRYVYSPSLPPSLPPDTKRKELPRK